MIRAAQAAFSALALVAGAVFVPTASAPAHEAYTPTWHYSTSDYAEAAQRDADDEFAAQLKRTNAIERVMLHEGGFSSHAADPGGATHFGITTREARRHGYSGSMRAMPRVTAIRIYESLWDESGAAAFDNYELATSAFDAYVAHGPRAKRWYSGLSGVSGCRAINGKRLSVYRGSSNWGVFGRGWSKRVKYNAEQCS